MVWHKLPPNWWKNLTLWVVGLFLIAFGMSFFIGPDYIDLPASPLTIEWVSDAELRIVTAEQVWSLQGSKLREFARPGFQARRAWLSPDGLLVAVINTNLEFELWSLETNQLLTSIPIGYYTEVAWSEDSRFVGVVEYNQSRIFILDRHNPEARHSILIERNAVDRIETIALHAQRNRVAVSFDSGDIVFYSLTGGQPVLYSTEDIYRTPRPLIWSPNGIFLAQGEVVWYKDDQKLMFHERISMPGHITSITFDGSGTYFGIIGGWAAEIGIPPSDRNIHVWNVETSEEVAVLRGQRHIGLANETKIFNQIRLSPRATKLASIDGDGVRIWELDLEQ